MQSNINSTTINISALKGSYGNMLLQPNYVLQIHTEKNPASFIINNKKLSSSQYHFSNEKNNLLVVDCGKFDVKENVVVK